jgi:hypothetical protein
MAARTSARPARAAGPDDEPGCGEDPVRPAPAWIAPLFGLLAVLLVPWTVWLGETLPTRHVSEHWDLAWAGFDVALAGALSLTALCALRGSPWLIGAATTAATLLVCDAWFDVLTSASGRQLAQALAEALLAELPLAGVCIWVAWNRERVAVRAARYQAWSLARRRDA